MPDPQFSYSSTPGLRVGDDLTAVANGAAVDARSIRPMAELVLGLGLVECLLPGNGSRKCCLQCRGSNYQPFAGDFNGDGIGDIGLRT